MSGQRLNRMVSTGEMLGGSLPLGRPSECPTCGAESELLTTPGGRKYYQLRCPCQRKRNLDSARTTFEAHKATWRHQQRAIGDLESVPERERDMAAWGAAWFQARRAAMAALELAQAFGFEMPASLNAWGQRHVGAAWEVR